MFYNFCVSLIYILGYLHRYTLYLIFYRIQTFKILYIYSGGFFTMALKNQYLIDLLETVKKRNAGEPEFIQAVMEELLHLSLLLKKDLT